MQQELYMPINLPRPVPLNSKQSFTLWDKVLSEIFKWLTIYQYYYYIFTSVNNFNFWFDLIFAPPPLFKSIISF